MIDNNPDILTIGDQHVVRGETKTIRVPVPGFSDYMPMQMLIRVIRSEKPGPRLLITGVMHGDEVIGVEIIHNLLEAGSLKDLLCGDIIIIPIVNAPGFINNSRTLPDGRDLNRSFPGSENGSLAGRLAHFLNTQVLSICTHAIDLHTGGQNHFNMPQLRILLQDKASLELAMAFAPPLIVNASQRNGSFRSLATEKRIPMLLFEGSEAGRFDEATSKAGSNGILNVLKHLKMLPGEPVRRKDKILIAEESHWLRSPKTGIFFALKNRAEIIEANEVIGFISEPLSLRKTEIRSPFKGIIIGENLIPVVHEGDALFNIAQLE